MGEAATGKPAATVLIVDDDEDTSATYARVLRLEGYRVLTAATAWAGLQQAESDPPDAILLDLHMPDVDGVQFLQRLRAGRQERAIPVVIVTGDYFVPSDIGAELRRLDAEVRFKPLWFEDLTSLVRTLITSRT